MPAPSLLDKISTFDLLRQEWRFLFYGLLMSFWSSLGQTFFISLFSHDIRTSLDLTHGEFGSYYAFATTASALTLFWLGKLADTVSVPRLSLMTLGGVCLAALHFSFVSSVFSLVLGFYLLRLSGQGMMYHVYSTAVTRRYIATRGRALALCGLGMPFGEAAFPLLVILALSITDWRTIWIILPIIAFFSFAPSIPFLTRRTLFQDGPGRAAHDSPEIPDDTFSVRRHIVMRDSAFWAVIIWLMMVPSFTITGLFFHQIYIAEAKGCAVMALVFKLYLVCAGSCWERIFFWLFDRQAYRPPCGLCQPDSFIIFLPVLVVGSWHILVTSVFCTFWRRRRYDTTSNKCPFGRTIWHKLVGRN